MHTLKIASLPLVSLLVIACGPSITTQVRYDLAPYDKNEYRQAKEGVVVENKPVKELPATFYAQAQACKNGDLVVDPVSQQKVMEKVSLASPGQLWYQVALTNQTGHVIRLNSAVIRLFDPAGNQIEPISKDDLSATFLTNRPCPSSQQVVNQIKLVKMLDRNAEILPDTTVTGWLAFQPPSWPIPGTWKLAIYEVPVAVNEAGGVTKTTRFEIRQVVKKFIDTYRQEGMFSPKVLVESKEATD